MSVELKEFGGAYFPKDKALKKNPELKPLAILIKALNKGIAEAVIFGKLAAEHPEHIDDYFKVKIWEHREDLPCPELDVLSPDFFGSSVVWNVNAGEPAAAPQPEDDENQNHSDDRQAEEMKSVRLLDQHSRAACLALFGPVEEITAAQYGQIVDLINDDQSSFEQHLAEALTKETRALALAPERQEQLLAWVREKASETAQWPDIKKLLAKWIDTPIEKREQATSTTSGQQRTESGATLGGGNPTDRSPDVAHNLQTLGIEVALGILSLYDDIDIYAIPSRFLSPAKGMSEAAQDTRFTTWFDLLRSTPGILDYSRAAIVALIKSTPESLWLKPVELREHINHELIESDHANPDQKTIDIACSAAPRNIPETHNEKTQQIHGDKTEIPAVCPARAAELDKELHDAFAHNKQPANDQPTIENLGGGAFSVDALIAQQPSNPAQKEEAPALLTAREQSIKNAVDYALSGQTNVFNQAEASEMIAETGRDVSYLSAMIAIDISGLEMNETPHLFCEEDIHHFTLTLLDDWSENPETRFDLLLASLAESRALDECDSSPAITKGEKGEDLTFLPSPPMLRTTIATIESPNALTYQQQLTLAALQGLCANPAYCTTSDEIPEMACLMARAIITEEAAQ